MFIKSRELCVPHQVVFCSNNEPGIRNVVFHISLRIDHESLMKHKVASEPMPLARPSLEKGWFMTVAAILLAECVGSLFIAAVIRSTFSMIIISVVYSYRSLWHSLKWPPHLIKVVSLISHLQLKNCQWLKNTTRDCWYPTSIQGIRG